jgi:hypothetical protein
MDTGASAKVQKVVEPPPPALIVTHPLPKFRSATVKTSFDRRDASTAKS